MFPSGGEAQLEDESGRVNEPSAALRASDKTAKDLEQEIGGLEAKGEGLAAEVARYREELDAQAHQLAVSPGREGVPRKAGRGKGRGEEGPGPDPLGSLPAPRGRRTGGRCRRRKGGIQAGTFMFDGQSLAPQVPHGLP